jgi:hypothetical protein
VGFVNADKTASEQHACTFRDASTAGMHAFGQETIAYRLKQVDTDKSFHYSGVAEIVLAAENGSSLSQNYPNPCNRTVHINFSLPRAGFVTLAVFDEGARELGKLLDGSCLDSGPPEVTFTPPARVIRSSDRRSLVLSATVDGFSLTRKMPVAGP